jgi:hypothetical protein
MSSPDAMIACVDQEAAPLCLALGSNDYFYIEQSLTDRLAELTAHQDVAGSTDCADKGDGPQWFPSSKKGSQR